MNVLYEIRLTALDMKQFPGRAVDLDTPIILYEDKLRHPLIRANIDAVDPRRNVGRDIVASQFDRLFLEGVYWEPVVRIGRFASNSIGQNQSAAMFFPTEQKPCCRHKKEEDEQQSPSRPMDLTCGSKYRGLTFPLRLFQ